MALLFTKIALLLLSVYGWYALHAFGQKNGAFSLIGAQRRTGHLGDTRVSYHQSLTGAEFVDEYLNVLLAFFWPMVDGLRPDASLHSFYFAGQGISIWMASQVEGLRTGNRMRIVSFTTMFGMLFQIIGMGVVGPLFLFVHLMTSPTASAPSVSNLTVAPNELLALPFSTFTGFIVPTILMSLHAPTYLTFEQKAFFIRLWQIFPILCYISQHFWKRILPLFTASKPATPDHQLRLLSKVYYFGITCASTAHVGTWMLSLTAYAFPALFAKDMRPYLLPGQVFVPAMPWSNAKTTTVATGAHWFLQWDEVCTSSMYLLWAISLAVKARQKTGEGKGTFGDVLGLISSALFVGPAGAALNAIWERDSLVFGDAQQRCTQQDDVNKENEMRR